VCTVLGRLPSSSSGGDCGGRGGKREEVVAAEGVGGHKSEVSPEVSASIQEALTHARNR
jgi:hypothetical protein